MFYLERCRVMQQDERVVYLTDTGQEIERLFNIPDKNTLFILLGTGTSITNAAVRKLSESNVVVGFCGSGGSPLVASVDASFVLPQDEYRPTQYAQAWFAKWMSDEERVETARRLLNTRADWAGEGWKKLDLAIPDAARHEFRQKLDDSQTTTDLLVSEAQWAKRLYAFLAREYDLDFKREEGKGEHATPAQTINRLIDHGNYLAYGYAAVALHGLGIPFSLPMLHGKTRRGGLVFDIADLVKDELVLPLAFEMGHKGVYKKLDRQFRGAIIDRADRTGVVSRLFKAVENLCLSGL